MERPVFSAIDSPYLVPFDGSFQLDQTTTCPPEGVAPKNKLKKQLKQSVRAIAELQKRLYAEDKWSLLLVFQAMDAAGKDGTIRALLTGVNPAGCQVYSFKKPSPEELDHDFLWRTARCLPERCTRAASALVHSFVAPTVLDRQQDVAAGLVVARELWLLGLLLDRGHWRSRGWMVMLLARED